MAIQKVGVVGCGLMGSGIAQVCAAAGFPTTVREVTAELVDKGLKGIEKNLNRLVEKGTIDEPAKRELFGALDTLCPPSTIFASNTSSLTITEIATATERPQRFVGLHFFNP